MSSYFDELSRNVSCIVAKDDSDFLRQVREIEQGMIKYVNVVLEQAELPDDLRNSMTSAIADFAVPENAVLLEQPKTVNDKKMHFNVSLHQSSLIEAMHDLFHVVSERKITTAKYGRIMDNPRFFASRVAEPENPAT